MSFAGAVLCGGESLRMGRDKALLPVDGVPMAQRVAEALVAAGAGTISAIGGDAPALARLGLAVTPDAEPGAGPLPATITALDATGAATVLVVSCDLLHPSPAAMRRVVEALHAGDGRAHAAVPVVGGRHQWTHAAWRSGAADVLRELRRGGTSSLRRARPNLRLVEVHGLDPRSTADADAPRDLSAAESPDPPGSLRPMEVPEIDVVALAAAHAAGAPVIDVREHHEFAEARVPGAHHIPLGEVMDRLDEVPREGTVYVICAVGGRSAKAAQHYRSQGIDAVNVAGGTRGWVSAGFPVEPPPGSGAGGA